MKKTVPFTLVIVGAAEIPQKTSWFHGDEGECRALVKHTPYNCGSKMISSKIETSEYYIPVICDLESSTLILRHIQMSAKSSI